MAGAEALILCDYAARRARGPSVLVIEPREHLFALRLVGTGADELHKLIAQIFRIHARSDVHMKAAEAHPVKHVYLPQKLFFLELAVPRPKRRGAVFARRRAKQFIGQGTHIILIIKHIFLPQKIFNPFCIV